MIVFKLNCFIIFYLYVIVQYMLVNVCLGLNMLCCIVIIVSEKMEETNNCIHLYTKKYDSINIVFTIVNRCHRCTISLQFHVQKVQFYHPTSLVVSWIVQTDTHREPFNILHSTMSTYRISRQIYCQVPVDLKTHHLLPLLVAFGITAPSHNPLRQKRYCTASPYSKTRGFSACSSNR